MFGPEVIRRVELTSLHGRKHSKITQRDQSTLIQIHQHRRSGSITTDTHTNINHVIRWEQLLKTNKTDEWWHTGLTSAYSNKHTQRRSVSVKTLPYKQNIFTLIYYKHHICTSTHTHTHKHQHYRSHAPYIPTHASDQPTNSKYNHLYPLGSTSEKHASSHPSLWDGRALRGRHGLSSIHWS